MSWLSDFLSALKPSSREEHFWAKIAGEEELENEYLPSSREEGFMYKIAEKVSQAGSGGGAVYATFTESQGTWTCDKTYDELKAAYDSGSIIFGSFQFFVTPMLFITEEDLNGFVGAVIRAIGDSSTITAIRYYEFGTTDAGTVFGRKMEKEFPT